MSQHEIAQEVPGILVRVPRPRSATDLRDLNADSARPTHITAFVPSPLPPSLQYNQSMISALARAMHAIGRLDTKANDLANPLILIQPLRNHEALTSSMIEGTLADLDTLVVFQENQVLPSPSSDVREVSNYAEALEYALGQPSDRPLSLFFVRELHRILMDGVRGNHSDPGQIRDRQVVIGRSGDRPENANYVPPPPLEVQPLLGDLENYINSDDELSPLIRISLVHYQFEAIHPFNDGNGRVGRLIIALLLKKWGLMTQPSLDLSAYMLRNREGYIRTLQHVSQQGNWAGWIEFFLHGVEEQARDAFRRGELLLELRRRYIERLRSEMKWNLVEPLVDDLFQNQRSTAKRLQSLLGVSPMTAQRMIAKLETMRIIEERTGKKRDRVYVAHEIIDVIDTSRL